MASSYKVGYQKPPPEHQFKKGQSGNQKGRPRGARNVATLLNEALDDRVPVTIRGKRRSMTLADAIIRRLTADAANGNIRAIELVLKLSGRAATAVQPADDDPDDKEILRRHEDRLRGRRVKAEDEV